MGRERQPGQDDVVVAGLRFHVTGECGAHHGERGRAAPGHAQQCQTHKFVKAHERRAHAVSSESRISWEDARSMHIDGTVVKRERRLETPQWAAGNALREVIVRYLERRLYLPPSTAPMQERLDAIQRKAETIAAAKLARLEGFLREYAQLQTKPDGPEKATRLRGLEWQITNLDTDIAMTKRGLASVVCAVVYLYHRCAWDGSQIAEHLGLRQRAAGALLAQPRGHNEAASFHDD